jgi:hypothetical protein
MEWCLESEAMVRVMMLGDGRQKCRFEIVAGWITTRHILPVQLTDGVSWRDGGGRYSGISRGVGRVSDSVVVETGTLSACGAEKMM